MFKLGEIANMCDFDNYKDFYLTDIKNYYRLGYIKYPQYMIYKIIIEMRFFNIYFILKENGSIVAITSMYHFDNIAFNWKGSMEDFMVFKNKYDNNTNLGWEEDIKLIINIVETQTLKYYGLR